MKSLKTRAEKFLPSPIWVVLSRFRMLYLSVGLFYSDKRRYKRNYSKSIKKSGQQQLDARLIFHAHSLEKGLSHSRIRLGFGREALAKLACIMQEYEIGGFDKQSKPYQNALSVLKQYILAHRAKDFKTPYLSELFGELISEARTSTSNLGGVTTVKKDSKLQNKKKNFKDLFNQRYSVREYGTEPVSLERIENAVELSMKTPSICNRQTSRVQIITDEKVIKQALSIQSGMTGYEAPPVLLVVLVDIHNYVAITERNQPYVDGGLFGMSVLLALEYEGLAACPLNAMFNRKQEKNMRSLLSTPDYENYVMFIAVGNFKNNTKVPKSFRYRGDEITHKL